MRSSLQSPVNGFVAGLLAAIIAITLWSVFGDPPANSSAPVVETSDAAAIGLVRDWQRMREATWVVESTFTRRVPGKAVISSAISEAQSPPDYLRRTAGGVDARISGHRYACGTLPDQSSTPCSDGGPDLSHSVRVEREVSDLRSRVLGPARAYDVQQLDENCYQLFARPALLPPTWGDRAEFCFDPATGAPLKSEFHRSGAVDSIVAARVSAVPSAEDFRLPGPTRRS